MKRFSLLGLSLLALLLVGAGCFTTTVNVPASNTNGTVKGATTSSLTIPLTITKSSGAAKKYSVQVQPNATALALLEQASSEQHFTLVKQTYSFGDMVTGIDGLNADDKHFWSFLVNGKEATVGAGTYTIKAGDTVEFRYESM